MSEVEELRRLGNAVVIAWERLGQCEDEFAPDYDPPACNEWRENLDNAILSLSAAITDHALDREACMCPPGWVVANFGWHRGPHGCPRYDLDGERRRATRSGEAP